MSTFGLTKDILNYKLQSIFFIKTLLRGILFECAQITYMVSIIHIKYYLHSLYFRIMK